jgi:hypothetical protein
MADVAREKIWEYKRGKLSEKRELILGPVRQGRLWTSCNLNNFSAVFGKKPFLCHIQKWQHIRKPPNYFLSHTKCKQIRFHQTSSYNGALNTGEVRPISSFVKVHHWQLLWKYIHCRHDSRYFPNGWMNGKRNQLRLNLIMLTTKEHF